MNWKPISEAAIKPFDAKQWYMPHSPRYLLWLGSYATIGSYEYTKKGKGRWRNDREVYPTHFCEIEGPQ